MCPGQVPGSRSDTVSERSTTLAPESDAKSKPPPLPVVPEATHKRHPPHAGCPRTLFLSQIRRNIRKGGFETRPYVRSVCVKKSRNNLPGRNAMVPGRRLL